MAMLTSLLCLARRTQRRWARQEVGQGRARFGTTCSGLAIASAALLRALACQRGLQKAHCLLQAASKSPLGFVQSMAKCQCISFALCRLKLDQTFIFQAHGACHVQSNSWPPKVADLYTPRKPREKGPGSVGCSSESQFPIQPERHRCAEAMKYIRWSRQVSQTGLRLACMAHLNSVCGLKPRYELTEQAMQLWIIPSGS